MNGKLPYPKLDAPTDSGKLEQLRSYLYQLVEQLNLLLDERQTADTPGDLSSEYSSSFIQKTE